MLIVLEGPEKVGKTAIGEALSKELGIPFWSRSGWYEEFEKFKEDTKSYDLFALDEAHLLSKIDFGKVDLIVDRDPILSEMVYSVMKNRFSRVTELNKLKIKWPYPNSHYFFILRNLDSEEARMFDLVSSFLYSQGVRVSKFWGGGVEQIVKAIRDTLGK